MIEPLLVDCKLIDRLSAGRAYFIDEISLDFAGQLGAEEIGQHVLALILYQHFQHYVLVLEHAHFVAELCFIRTIPVRIMWRECPVGGVAQ